MAYIVRSKKPNWKTYLVIGEDKYEFFWCDDLIYATQFKTPEEATMFLLAYNINEVDIICLSELYTALASTLTLEQLKEGEKFQYATGGNLTFMKIVQPPKGDELEHAIAETDGRYYLHPCSDASWVVIIENSGKHHPNCAVGRVIALNNGVLVNRLA